MRRKKTRLPRKSLTYASVGRALIDAMHDTYGQHEASTSDSYLKRRLSNATGQMVARVMLKLFPKLSVRRGTTLNEWKVTLEDVGKFQETLARYEARAQ